MLSCGNELMVSFEVGLKRWQSGKTDLMCGKLQELSAAKSTCVHGQSKDADITTGKGGSDDYMTHFGHLVTGMLAISSSFCSLLITIHTSFVDSSFSNTYHGRWNSAGDSGGMART